MNNTEGKNAINRLGKATALFWIGAFIYVFLVWAHAFEVRFIIAFILASVGSILGGPWCYVLGEGVSFIARRLSKANAPPAIVFFTPGILVSLCLCVAGFYESRPEVRFRHLFEMAPPEGIDIKAVDGAMKMDGAIWLFTCHGPTNALGQVLDTLRLKEVSDPKGAQGWSNFLMRTSAIAWRSGGDYTLLSNNKTEPQVLAFMRKDQRTVRILLSTHRGDLLQQ